MILSLFLLSFLFSLVNKNKFGFSLLATTISLSINYIIFFFVIIISFLVNLFFLAPNDYINLLIMFIFHSLLLFYIFKIPRVKNGFNFLQNKLKNDYFEILILNISVTILFCFIISSNFNLLFTSSVFISIIMFSIISFISIQNTLTMYYKHKLLVTELNNTKSELEEKNKEIAKLEAENLEYSKTAHSIAHKQKSLEHKLNELILQAEVADELDIRDRLDNISKEYSKNIASTPLVKTEIEILDDMFSYMSSECTKNNIDFELQLNGNIHHMINKFVTKEELEILLADHIKDAIIAINHSDNINKSILVKLGMFDGNYSLTIYDSGIEFEVETLINLGLKPSTTHKENGGTGMGFMNTFDTLKKYKASLYINEIGKPNKENYTKYISIKFDSKNKFNIISYRKNEISKINNRTDLIVE